MKLVLYSWNANNEQILADNLEKSGFEVVWFCKECRHYTRDMELAMELIPFIHAQGAEAVISFNYFPILSMICNTCQIPYYAWIYDCPHFTLYAKQIVLPCNHIGIFDQAMVRQLQEEYGIGTVYHVPLAADGAYFDSVIEHASEEEKARFQCDISFVGSLYTDEHNYYDSLFGKETGQAAADDIIRQCFAYHKDYLRLAVSGDSADLHRIQMRMEKQGLMLGEDYYAKTEDILLASVLEKKVTVEERRILLTRMASRFAGNYGSRDSAEGVIRSEQRMNAVKAIENKEDIDKGYSLENKYDFRLYTGSDTGALQKLDLFNRGTVDYRTQMPLVFAGSKINLNISLRSIHSGIPLRVLDIMACGGFVLSNWQPEIAEYFEEGVEIVTFDSLEDCLDKAAYYLSHEEERRQIAANGRDKVREKFSYAVGLDRLFSCPTL